MRKTFDTASDFAEWLSVTLATDHMEPIYEEMQLQLGEVCIPLGNTHNRRVIRDLLIQTLTPVLPFVTRETIHTLERVSTAENHFRYMADTLLQDLYMEECEPIFTILSMESLTIVRHEVYVEEHHMQGLSLERLWRLAVLHYFAESPLPFSYIITGQQAILTDRTDGYEKNIRCTDTNVYERAYEAWHELERRHERIYAPPARVRA